MQLHFSKYHGTGNDFILLDNRAGDIVLSIEQVAQLCHRKFGIGADGLMLLEQAEGYHFKMVYYNSDGRESSMCGNGGRCIVAFAHKLGILTDDASFIAIDGAHKAHIHSNGDVTLHMQDVHEIEEGKGYFLLNTGSPHYIKEVADASATDVYHDGKQIRYSQEFAPGGVNVNFVQRQPQGLFVRTYERGVEDETLSCGTGVTAAAIALTSDNGSHIVPILTPGGSLQVSFNRVSPQQVVDVTLTGNAVFVFEGKVTI